jgi:hypothetical protein
MTGFDAESIFRLPTADQLEKLQQDAHREGYAAGYEEGTARVRMEAMRLHSVIEQLDEALAALDNKVAQDVLRLGVEIARQVVRQAIAVKPEVVLSVVKEAINSAAAPAHCGLSEPGRRVARALAHGRTTHARGTPHIRGRRHRTRRLQDRSRRKPDRRDGGDALDPHRRGADRQRGLDRS